MLERFIGLYAVDVGFVQTNIRRHGAMRRDLRRRSSGASRPTRRDAVDLRQQPHWVQSRPPTAPRSRFNSIASQLDTWLLPARIMPTSYQNLPVVGKAASLSCPSALLLDAYWLLSLQYEAVIAEAKSTLWSSALLTLVILLTCHSLTCSVSQSVSVRSVYQSNTIHGRDSQRDMPLSWYFKSSLCPFDAFVGQYMTHFKWALYKTGRQNGTGSYAYNGEPVHKF